MSNLKTKNILHTVKAKLYKNGNITTLKILLSRLEPEPENISNTKSLFAANKQTNKRTNERTYGDE